MTTNQNHSNKILSRLLKYGSITQDEATHNIGCRRLAARIHDLRRAGYNIKTISVKGLNGNHYARYVLNNFKK